MLEPIHNFVRSKVFSRSPLARPKREIQGQPNGEIISSTTKPTASNVTPKEEKKEPRKKDGGITSKKLKTMKPEEFVKDIEAIVRRQLRLGVCMHYLSSHVKETILCCQMEV